MPIQRLLRILQGRLRPSQSSSARLRGFAVCTLPRSGSNFFCDILGRTGVLGKPKEYFNGHARRIYDDPEYPDDPLQQIARILTMGATPNGVYGLKVFPGLHDVVAPHLRWTEVLPDLRFVRFRRRDNLAQAISWVRANQTQQFRSADACHGEPFYDPDAIALRLRQICQRNARWDMFFARTGLHATEVIFEDFLLDPNAAIEAIAQTVDVGQVAKIDIRDSLFQKQGDAANVAWAEQFRSERGDPNFVDPA